MSTRVLVRMSILPVERPYANVSDLPFAMVFKYFVMLMVAKHASTSFRAGVQSLGDHSCKTILQCLYNLRHVFWVRFKIYYVFPQKWMNTCM